jgi:hypothetical protein
LIIGAKIANRFLSNDQIKQQLFKKPSDQVHLKHDKEIDVETLNNQDEFENLDQMSNICHEIKWNVVKNSSSILLFNIQSNSEKTICSLSNIEPTMEYTHMCQYG